MFAAVLSADLVGFGGRARLVGILCFPAAAVVNTRLAGR
jgi:hypothetical protein